MIHQNKQSTTGQGQQESITHNNMSSSKKDMAYDDSIVMPLNYNFNPIIPCNMIVTTIHDKPCITISKTFSNKDIIKTIITAANYDKPILIFPMFKNRITAGSLLVKHKVCKYNPENDKFEFLI